VGSQPHALNLWVRMHEGKVGQLPTAPDSNRDWLHTDFLLICDAKPLVLTLYQPV